MTWRVLAILLPAACAASAFTHWVNQWATRTINRHITTALDFPDWEAELDRPYNWQDDGL